MGKRAAHRRVIPTLYGRTGIGQYPGHKPGRTVGSEWGNWQPYTQPESTVPTSVVDARLHNGLALEARRQ
jgi:hypothetical protein